MIDVMGSVCSPAWWRLLAFNYDKLNSGLTLFITNANLEYKL